MEQQINWKKIGLYILIAFSISWAVAGYVILSNIEMASTLGLILIAGLYMPGPAIATFIIQKFIYKEGFRQYGWTFDKKALKWIFLTPLIFVALLGITFAVIGIFGNTHLVDSFGQLNFTQENFNRQLTAMLGEKIDMEKVKLPALPSEIMFFAFILQGIIAGATVNIPFMFGEEFGWRGLMLRETQALGFVKSSILIGIVWGLWHLPIILLGHNYPGNPQAGVFMMCVFTTALSPAFSYVRIKTRTILGPCMLHGMINATANMFILYVANGNEFFGSIAGWAGVIAGCMIGIGIYVWDRPFVQSFKSVE